MPIPFVVEDTFRLNPNSKISYHENYVCIDDFYANIEGIQDLFENMYVESWKMSKWSRNFIDYYDCRPCFANWEPIKEKIDSRLEPINSLICNMLETSGIELERNISFNVFKHKKQNVPNTMQHHPHYDTNMVNILVYIDKFADGGTCLYKNKEVVNKEASTLLVDTSEYEVLEIIPAKPNRCVIFNGNQLHGAYIENNNTYYDNWRITQATIVKYALDHLEVRD